MYQLLGVARTATTKEIKTAYRKKALDTHPDKNKDVPQEEAAEAFRRVVHAFEILSDKDSRQRYDRTGRIDQAQQQQHQQRWSTNHGGSRTWTFTWSTGHRHRPSRLKDKFEVKEAQSRILHLVSLEQLETVIVDDETGELERNLVIAFYTPQLEEHLMDEMVYPYPFAAMSTQGIWWEDLMQTTSVRFHRKSKVADFFRIPLGDQMESPTFVFCKRGEDFETLPDKCTRLETRDRQRFENWMWEQIRVEVVLCQRTRSPSRDLLDPWQKSKKPLRTTAWRRIYPHNNANP